MIEDHDSAQHRAGITAAGPLPIYTGFPLPECNSLDCRPFIAYCEAKVKIFFISGEQNGAAGRNNVIFFDCIRSCGIIERNNGIRKEMKMLLEDLKQELHSIQNRLETLRRHL